MLDSAGSKDVEAAILAGDIYAATLWRLAMGETRASIFARIQANADKDGQG